MEAHQLRSVILPLIFGLSCQLKSASIWSIRWLLRQDSTQWSSTSIMLFCITCWIMGARKPSRHERVQSHFECQRNFRSILAEFSRHARYTGKTRLTWVTRQSAKDCHVGRLIRLIFLGRVEMGAFEGNRSLNTARKNNHMKIKKTIRLQSG